MGEPATSATRSVSFRKPPKRCFAASDAMRPSPLRNQSRSAFASTGGQARTGSAVNGIPVFVEISSGSSTKGSKKGTPLMLLLVSASRSRSPGMSGPLVPGAGFDLRNTRIQSSTLVLNSSSLVSRLSAMRRRSDRYPCRRCARGRVARAQMAMQTGPDWYRSRPNSHESPKSTRTGEVASALRFPRLSRTKKGTNCCLESGGSPFSMARSAELSRFRQTLMQNTLL